MSYDTFPVSEIIEGSVILEDRIFNDAKILAVDNENRFVVLVYGPDGYHAHRVDTVYYSADQATAELKRRQAGSASTANDCDHILAKHRESRDRIKQGTE
jgi:hypothetical protein